MKALIGFFLLFSCQWAAAEDLSQYSTLELPTSRSQPKVSLICNSEYIGQLDEAISTHKNSFDTAGEEMRWSVREGDNFWILTFVTGNLVRFSIDVPKSQGCTVLK